MGGGDGTSDFCHYESGWNVQLCPQSLDLVLAGLPSNMAERHTFRNASNFRAAQCRGAPPFLQDFSALAEALAVYTVSWLSSGSDHASVFDQNLVPDRTTRLSQESCDLHHG